MTKFVYVTYFGVIIPLSMFQLGGFTVGISDCLIAFLAYLSVLSLTATYGGGVAKTKLHVALLLLILASVISYGANLGYPDVARALTTFTRWLATWLSFFGIYYIFYGRTTAREVMTLERIILAGGVAVLFLVALTSVSPTLTAPFFKTEITQDALSKVAEAGVVRDFLPYWGTDRLAPFLTLLLNIAFAHVVLEKSQSRYRKPLYILFFVTVAYFLIHTYTRSALVSSAVSVVITMRYAVSLDKKKIFYLAFIALACMVLVSFFPDFVLPYVAHREAPSYAPVVGIGSGGEKIVSGNLLGRLYIASLGLKKFAKHPIFGNGFGSTLQGLTYTFGHAHDSYVSALYMLGIVGFSIYIVVLFGIGRIAKRATGAFAPNSPARAFAIAFYSWFIGLLVMSLSESVLFWPYEIIFIVMLITAVLSCASSPEREGPARARTAVAARKGKTAQGVAVAS